MRRYDYRLAEAECQRKENGESWRDAQYLDQVIFVNKSRLEPFNSCSPRSFLARVM